MNILDILHKYTDEEVTVRVTVNYESMHHRALQYALHTRILSPEDLADEIKADLQNAAENYNLKAEESIRTMNEIIAVCDKFRK